MNNKAERKYFMADDILGNWEFDTTAKIDTISLFVAVY
jgi:hypothetical protein